MPKYGATEAEYQTMNHASVIIDHKAPYTIDSEIYYDFPLLDIGMHVIDPEVLEEGEEARDDDSEQTEILMSGQGVHLLTDSHHKDKLTAIARNKVSGTVRKEGQVTFILEDKLAYIITKELRQLKKFKNADLYTHVDLSIHVKGGENETIPSIELFKDVSKPTIAGFDFISGEDDASSDENPFEDETKGNKKSVSTAEFSLSFENTKSISVILFFAG